MDVLLEPVLKWINMSSVLIFLCILLLVTDYLKFRKPPNSPPGPRGLPFVGSLFHMDTKLPQLYLMKMAEVHGNIFDIRLGKDRMVVVVGFKMVKEALITQGDEFIDRPPSPMINRLYEGGRGLFFSSGYKWKEQRRFALSTLRNLGLGKRVLEEAILEECRCIQEEVELERAEFAAGFDEANLVLCVTDLLLAGSETTYTTLRWAMLYMVKYPHIQKKVQEEIDRVIGSSRQPNMADRANMSYTDAVIHEIQRMGNIIPLGVPHMATRDTTLGGYSIPKGTTLLYLLASVLADKAEWKTPDSFDPENFLDTEGNFVRKEAFLPFSAGKRVCLGERLARMELFLFFTSLLQKYNISAPEGAELHLDTKGGGTNAPVPFKICAKAR